MPWDNMFRPELLFIFWFGLLFIAGCIGLISWIKLQINKITAKLEAKYAAKNKKSNDIARNVLRGQLLEQFAPIKAAELDNLNLFDFRFLGDFADYIVLDGYTDVKDGVATEVKRVIFLEIKSGDAKTSAHQKAIINAIKSGRVEHKIIRLPGNLEEW